MKVTVTIITKDRKEACLRCIKGVINQKYKIWKFVLVEDITNNQYFSLEILHSLFPDTKCSYIATREKNISNSRNLAFSEASGDIVLSIDDDVVIKDEKFIEKHVEFHKKNSSITVVCGLVKPLVRNVWSVFSFYYYNQEMIFVKKPQRIAYYALSCVSFKIKKIKNAYFDTSLLTGEDIDFMLDLHEQGEKIFFCPNLEVYHLFPVNFFQFVLKHYKYGNCYAAVSKKHPQYISMDLYLPHNSINLALFPFYVLNAVIRNSEIIIKKLQLPLKFIFPSIVHEFSTFIGIYFSKEGQEMLKLRYLQLLKKG